MKRLLLATAFSALSTAAFAGSYAEPVVDPAVIVADAASSVSQQWLVPATFLIILLLVM